MPPCEGGYKEFKVGDLFDVSTSKSVDKNGLIPTVKTHDSIQFIGRTQTNNGLQGYTKRLSFDPNPAQTFSIVQVGESVMQYRESKWYASQNIFLLKPLLAKLVDAKLYIIGATNKALMIFNGGYNIYPTLDKLKDLRITLPTTSTGEIDFQFMESRIRELEEERVRELEEERVRELEAYLSAAGFANCNLTPKEEDALRKFSNVTQTKNFKVGTLFSAQTGDVDLQQKDINGKGVYFINSGVQNFGIKGKTDRNARIFNANTITIDFFGNAYYRPFSYKLATHNHVFSLFGEAIKNENVGLFFVSMMSYFTKLYSFNNMGTWSSIKDLDITLPITPWGEIDYAFMETYISAIKKQIIQQVKDFIAKEHAAYQRVINA